MLEKGSRARAIIGSIVFFFIAPFVVGGVVPYLLVGWQWNDLYIGFDVLRIVGGAVSLTGLACVLECFGRFALEGRGTPAPVLQTEILIASGLYRFVRNPMYVAVLMIVLGQALFFGQILLFGYAVLVWVGFHAFVRIYEEPQLQRRFGTSYETYCLHVRRWWPRATPWRASRKSNFKL